MLKCLIVDDEPIARNILESYVQKTSILEHAGSLDNALEVVGFLSKTKVDILFLDINMPEFTGMDLLKTLQNAPQVILTTAYSEYGAESYEFNVIDYLMKPITIGRFMKAIDKVLSTIQSGSEQDHMLFIKEDHKIHKIPARDIDYIQSFGNYSKIHKSGKMILTREPLSKILEMSNELVRVHKSFVIGKQQIELVQGNTIKLLCGKTIPIGRAYKKQFQEFLLSSNPNKTSN